MRQSNLTRAHMGHWRRFIADTSGATAIEYALMAAGIGVAIMGTISSTGQAIKTTLWDAIVNALSNS
jgi:pilus assembly protein Flp/PilA